MFILWKKNTASSSFRTNNELYFQFNIISRKVLINKRQNFLLLKLNSIFILNLMEAFYVSSGYYVLGF